jgi:hypothetical protein
MINHIATLNPDPKLLLSPLPGIPHVPCALRKCTPYPKQ